MGDEKAAAGRIDPGRLCRQSGHRTRTRIPAVRCQVEPLFWLSMDSRHDRLHCVWAVAVCCLSEQFFQLLVNGGVMDLGCFHLEVRRIDERVDSMRDSCY